MQAKADYAPYYKHSLLYLACVDVASDITADQRLLLAHDLGISAFLGDTIYNFGELVRLTPTISKYPVFIIVIILPAGGVTACLRSQLMHPILDALDNTQHDWIKKLLFTFNEGNIGKFEALAPLFPQEVRACVHVCLHAWCGQQAESRAGVK